MTIIKQRSDGKIEINNVTCPYCDKPFIGTTMSCENKCFERLDKWADDLIKDLEDKGFV